MARVVLIISDPRRIVADLTAAIEATGNGQVSQRLRGLRNQIEAQTKPPKPAEPTGLGAVVEDASGRVYVRGYEPSDTYTHPWHVIDPSATACMAWWKWDDIDVVRVLSEGVS